MSDRERAFNKHGTGSELTPIFTITHWRGCEGADRPAPTPDTQQRLTGPTWRPYADKTAQDGLQRHRGGLPVTFSLQGSCGSRYRQYWQGNTSSRNLSLQLSKVKNVVLCPFQRSHLKSFLADTYKHVLIIKSVTGFV